MPNSSDFENMLNGLCRSVETINNFCRGRDTFVVDRGEIDERISEELKNCRNSMRDIEKHFLGMVLQDARNISQAAVNNPNVSEKAIAMLERMSELLKEFSREKAMDINKSEYLKRSAAELKEDIKRLRESTEREVGRLGKNKQNMMKDLSSRYPEAH